MKNESLELHFKLANTLKVLVENEGVPTNLDV